MKKSFVKIIAITLALITIACVFTSCAGKLSGKYSNGVGSTALVGVFLTYDFSGDKVKLTIEAGAVGAAEVTELEGKYEITEKEDGKQEITFTFEGGNSEYSGTKSFEKLDDSIKIGGVEYKKTK